MHDANYKISSFNGNSHVRSKFCAFLCVLIQVSLTVVSFFLFISSVSHTDVNEPQNMNFPAGYCADTLGVQTPRAPEKSDLMGKWADLFCYGINSLIWWHWPWWSWSHARNGKTWFNDKSKRKRTKWSCRVIWRMEWESYLEIFYLYISIEAPVR